MSINNLGEKLNSHDFEKISTYRFKCKKCGFEAFGDLFIHMKKPTLFYNLYVEILSCDEMMIKDIIE